MAPEGDSGLNDPSVTGTVSGDNLPEKYRWKGPGPAPAKWWADDGTLVYRSYDDYCWD